MEVEKLRENDLDICLTETQLKYDKLEITEGLGKIESHRDMKGRRGGGLMIFNLKRKIKINKIITEHPDVLIGEVDAKGFKFRIILAYFSVNDDARNSMLKNLIEKELGKDGGGCTVVLGDFNARVGFLGAQKLNKNEELLLDIMNNHDVTLLNHLD